MEEDFIYWRHHTPVGIKVEEISGGGRYADSKTHHALALQIYCENGRDGYREVEHFDNGAPYLDGDPSRISITHTPGLLAVATLPKTPETDLRRFSERTAMGIDAERRDRRQVLDIRDRFLSEKEKGLAAPDDVEGNIALWTAKEALYKAAMTPGLDWREDIFIASLPVPMTAEEGPDGKPRFNFTEGKARVRIDGQWHDMHLYSYDSDDHRVTLAYSPRAAKFMKSK